MEALLREAGEGLALGSSSGDGPQCRSAGELKNKIALLFGGKVSDTRAERVSASFEIPADVVLKLSEVPLDPTPSVPDPDINAVQVSSILRKSYTVREVVVSQPDAETDPLAQKAVAAFLMMHVRQADGSVWGVQSASRTTQGWTVSYVCQHSMACWKQGNTRQKKHIIGLSTTDDMINYGSLARPAFDCRGVVNITFSRFSRSVVIKYDHTNFHRSVSDLVKLFPPPQPPSPLQLPVSASASGSTNKRSKDGQNESGATPKRKKPRNSATAQGGETAAEETAGATAETSGTAEQSASASAPKRKRSRKSAAAISGDADTAEGTGGVSGPIQQDGTPAAIPTKVKKPRKPYVRKSNKGAAAASTDGSATAAQASSAQGTTNIAAAAVDVMMDLGIDVNPNADLNEAQVAEALLQHLHEFPEDNTGTAAAMMDALADNASASEANWQLSRESAAAATSPPDTVAPTTGRTFSNDQAAVATAAPPRETLGNTTEQPRPYMLVTEAEVSNARKATAIKLLSERGVEPGTLTHEQFCTFSNQAPALQKESLELLAHYGAERLAIVPAANGSNSDIQSPVPTPAPTANGDGSAQASTTPQPAHQAHASPPVVTPVLAPAPALFTSSPAKSSEAAKQPAKRRQSKAAAAATQIPIPAPDHTATTAQNTAVSLTGLHGGNVTASLPSTTQSSWQAQQQQEQQQNAAPPAAKTGGRRKSSATAASTTPVQSQVLPLEAQASPVPLPATAYPRQAFVGTPAASAAPVSAIVDKPARAPRKPRAPRQRKSAATIPVEEDDSNVLPAAGLAQQTATTAAPESSAAAYTTGSREQQATIDYYRRYTQQPQQPHQSQQQHYSHQPSASDGQRNTTSAVLSPPMAVAEQAAPSLASYQSSNRQHVGGVPYSQPSTVGAISTGTGSTGNDYSQYNNHGRVASTGENTALTAAAAVTMTAQVPSTTTAQPLFDTYLNERRTSSTNYSGNTSTTGATSMATANSTSNRWPTTNVDNSYMAKHAAQQQRQGPQPQQLQQPPRTTTSVGYGAPSRPSDAGYAQLLQQQQQQQQQGQQSASRTAQHRQQQARTQSPAAAYGDRPSHPPASSGYGQGTSSAAAPAAPMHHLGSGSEYQRQPQIQQQHTLHGQAQQHYTQPYQQHSHQHQNQHQPHQQHQNNQQHQSAGLGLGNGRNAYGNQVMTDEMYDVLRRQQSQ